MSTVPRPRQRKEDTTSQTRPLTVITDRCTLVIPPGAHTMDGFREWATSDDFPERVRVTYIDGEITIDMSNEEINAHVLVKSEIVGVLQPLTKRLRLGIFF